MKYKALILDLDGTAVAHGQLTPSRRVIETVHQAHNHIHICIATGRILNGSVGAKPIMDSLQLSGPCILDQGAQIYDPVKKKIILEIPLDRSLIQQIYEIMSTYHLQIKYFNGEEDLVYDRAKTKGKIISLFAMDFDTSIIPELVGSLQKIPQVAVHRMVGSESHLASIEITNASATKQHGIAVVVKILGLQTHEIIGVGDGYNDFPLLMACGLKIAMGNAVPEIKAIADFVAPSVDEDGVATVIEKFILNHQ